MMTMEDYSSKSTKTQKDSYLYYFRSRFENQNHELVESVGTYELKVIRCSGARGRVIVPYWTEDGTAKQGKEYEKQDGQLIFENNESE